jgi:hypothetical protein
VTAAPLPQLPPIGDRRLTALWQHWLAVRGGKAMPARRGIDPAHIPTLLPFLFVYDYHPDTSRFFCRLAGEEIFAAAGIHGAKKFIEELFQSPTLERVRERYRRVVLTPSVIHTRGLLRVASGYRIPGERLVLPLASDGVTPDGLIGATIYRRNEALSPMQAMNAPLAPEQMYAVPAPA